MTGSLQIGKMNKKKKVVFPQDNSVFFNLKTAPFQFTQTYVEFLSSRSLRNKFVLSEASIIMVIFIAIIQKQYNTK